MRRFFLYVFAVLVLFAVLAQVGYWLPLNLLFTFLLWTSPIWALVLVLLLFRKLLR
ncbi:hypothetical protein [Hymenobacter pini]|uniref:hypothetical protein n=1 Tax=Hymenobacter pini TaxID=2880879 RepID=UPI001CF274FD|nr:hypothetical protein [Hymenobacter pini]MCA8830293.1 hypothetical protein [Hymenobacter pini]